MTADQITISKALEQVTYFPGSWDKRMMQSLAGMANFSPDKELTEKQNEWMYRLLYKYRKQLHLTYSVYKNNPLCTKLNKENNSKSE